MGVSFDPENPFLNKFLTSAWRSIYNNLYWSTETCEQPKCTLMGQYLNKLWNQYTEYYCRLWKRIWQIYILWHVKMSMIYHWKKKLANTSILSDFFTMIMCICITYIRLCVCNHMHIKLEWINCWLLREYYGGLSLSLYFFFVKLKTSIATLTLSTSSKQINIGWHWLSNLLMAILC